MASLPIILTVGDVSSYYSVKEMFSLLSSFSTNKTPKHAQACCNGIKSAYFSNIYILPISQMLGIVFDMFNSICVSSNLRRTFSWICFYS